MIVLLVTTFEFRGRIYLLKKKKKGKTKCFSFQGHIMSALGLSLSDKKKLLLFLFSADLAIYRS